MTFFKGPGFNVEFLSYFFKNIIVSGPPGPLFFFVGGGGGGSTVSRTFNTGLSQLSRLTLIKHR